MDLEKLTKTQIILLALLVSFVTSIATGITTVTLMDQAPPFITQPITRVVQRTVERIIPGETKEIIITETFIIKEEDLIVEAINANRSNIAAISSLIDDEDSEEQVVGGGFIISRSGFIVIDSALVSEEGSYSLSMGDDIFNVEFITESEEGFSLLQITLPDGQMELSSYATLIGAKNLNEGQSVIALSGPSISVSTGIISGFLEKEIVIETSLGEEIEEGSGEEGSEVPQETVTVLDKIITTLNLSLEQSGSIVINSDGQVIGFAIVRDGKTVVIPANYLIEAIAQAPLDTLEEEAVE